MKSRISFVIALAAILFAGNVMSVSASTQSESWTGTTDAHRFGDYSIAAGSSVKFTFKTVDGSKFTMSTEGLDGKIYIDGVYQYATGHTDDYYTIGNTIQQSYTDAGTHTVEVVAPSSINNKISIHDVMIKHPTTSISSTVKYVTLTEAGDLKYYISDAEKYYIKKLTVSGPLNEDDMQLIRQMGGAEYNQYYGGSIMGELQVLNLADASLVSTTGKPIGRCDGVYYGTEGDYEELQSIYMTSGIIDDFLFSGLSNITEFTIPVSVTSIGNGAFYRCSKLTTLTFPSGMALNEVGKNNRRYVNSSYTFDGCGITRVNICDVDEWCGITFHEYSDNPLSRSNCFYASTTASSPVTDLNISSGVTRIGGYSFYTCNKLKSITLPAGIKYVGSAAFQGCSSVTSVNLGGGLGIVCNDAFKDCSAITSVNTNDLKEWTESSFYPSDTWVLKYDDSGRIAYGWDDGPYEIEECRYVFLSNPVYYTNVLKCNGTAITELSIPEGTTKVGMGAFANFTGITSVTFPVTVTSVGAFAFDNCTSLKRINVADIGAWAAINFEPYWWHYYCANLGDYDEYHGTYDWSQESKQIFTSNPLTCTMDLYANGVKVTDAVLTDGTNRLGDYSFYFYTPMVSLDIPASVTSISKNALFGCVNLTDVYVHWTTPLAISGSTELSKMVTLHVPYGTKSAYEADDIWGCFKNIVEMEYTRVSSVTLDAHDASLKAGETVQLSASAAPDDAYFKDVTWSSSNPEVATVSETGLVTALDYGTATIYATATDDSGQCDSCVVSVAPILVESIVLSSHEASLHADETVQLSASVAPDNASFRDVTWSSSNPEVATVSETGLVTALDYGSAIIYATATDGSGQCDSCVVSVDPILVESIVLNRHEASLYLDETVRLSASVAPEDASFKNVRWSSSNPEVATVSKMGMVTALDYGSATIYATATDGSGKCDSCVVSVVPILVESIVLNYNEIEVVTDSTIQLSATVLPENANNKDLTWETMNQRVARVNSEGVVTGCQTGTATIVARAVDGSEVYATCVVTVVEPDGILDVNCDDNISGIYTLDGRKVVSMQAGIYIIIYKDGTRKVVNKK